MCAVHYMSRARRPLGQVVSEVRDSRVVQVAVAPGQRLVFERRGAAEPDLAQAHLGRGVAGAGRDDRGVLGEPPHALPRGLVGHVQPEGPADERSGPGEVDEVMVGDALTEHTRQADGRGRPPTTVRRDLLRSGAELRVEDRGHPPRDVRAQVLVGDQPARPWAWHPGACVVWPERLWAGLRLRGLAPRAGGGYIRLIAVSGVH